MIVPGLGSVFRLSFQNISSYLSAIRSFLDFYLEAEDLLTIYRMAFSVSQLQVRLDRDYFLFASALRTDKLLMFKICYSSYQSLFQTIGLILICCICSVKASTLSLRQFQISLYTSALHLRFISLRYFSVISDRLLFLFSSSYILSTNQAFTATSRVNFSSSSLIMSLSSLFYVTSLSSSLSFSTKKDQYSWLELVLAIDECAKFLR